MATSRFDVQPLPYALDALASKGMSRETVDLHYNKHHKGYATRLKSIAAESPKEYEGKSVADIVRSAKLGSVPYNMAAQIWNHDFFWRSMSPEGGKVPEAGKSALVSQIAKDFGSVENFVKQFTATATGHFGSGWCWLLWNSKTGKLEVKSSHDADCPLSFGHTTPLLVCDVWEHAYYVDFRNDRAGFVKNWWRLTNWQFAERNFAAVNGLKSKL
jgi:Fe-Mn family superoxide dismutase